MATGIEIYRSNYFLYPPSLEMLKNRGEDLFPYSSLELFDAWGNKYFYTTDGKIYKLISFGADREPGGSGMNEDIIPK